MDTDSDVRSDLDYGDIDEPELHTAAAGDDVERCRELLAAGVGVDSPAADGSSTALCFAAKSGALAACRLLLDAGANVHGVTERGATTRRCTWPRSIGAWLCASC